jgi:hypothetical protein
MIGSPFFAVTTFACLCTRAAPAQGDASIAIRHRPPIAAARALSRSSNARRTSAVFLVARASVLARSAPVESFAVIAVVRNYTTRPAPVRIAGPSLAEAIASDCRVTFTMPQISLVAGALLATNGGPKRITEPVVWIALVAVLVG